MTAIRVIDASVVGAWILPDEDSVAAERHLRVAPGQSLVAPFHFPAEMANVILVATRRGRISEPQADRFREQVAGLPLEIDQAGPASLQAQTPGLARSHQLTIYDALYLELALRLGCPLATFDRALARAAEAEGVLPA